MEDLFRGKYQQPDHRPLRLHAFEAILLFSCRVITKILRVLV